jgi:hypothetical protein
MTSTKTRQPGHWRSGQEKGSVGTTVSTRNYDRERISQVQASALAWVTNLKKHLADPGSAPTDKLLKLSAEMLVLSGRATNGPETLKAMGRLVDRTGDSHAAALKLFGVCESVAGDPSDTRDYDKWKQDNLKAMEVVEEPEQEPDGTAESVGGVCTAMGDSNE